MQNTGYEERRTFERIPAKVSLRCLDLYSNKELLAQTQDISAKGIGLLTDEKLSPYTPLEMWLEVPDKGDLLYTRGGVRWSKMVEPNKYRVGISLEKADLMGMSRVLRTVIL